MAGIKTRDATVDEFEARLRPSAARLEGYRRSFEYIQDYVNIYGNCVWKEETFRVVAYNVEQECNTAQPHARPRAGLAEPSYQSVSAPIPGLRAHRRALASTSPVDRARVFEGRTAARADRTAGRGGPAAGSARMPEIFGVRTFAVLRDAVGVGGLAGLDRLLSFMATQRLRTAIHRSPP